MDTNYKGDLSETAILARLIELGCSVSIPWGHNQRYDLIVDVKGMLFKAQCKTGRLRNGTIEFDSCSRYRNKEKDYTGQIDWFLVYCPDTKQVYKVPIDQIVGPKIYLRIDPYKDRQYKKCPKSLA